MLKELIEYLIGLSEPMKVKVGEREYSNKGLSLVPDPIPDPIQIHTLTGFSGYLKSGVDEWEDGELIFHISSPATVYLYSSLSQNTLNRPCFICATCLNPFNSIGQWFDLESFIIILQSRFVPDENIAALLKLVGNIKDGTVTTHTDDGHTQAVTAKVGLTKVEQIDVPNPVFLRPYRTFREIEQPSSPFSFRMRSGQGGQPPTCALFEADGGAWQMVAISYIEDWFEKNLHQDIPVIA